MYKKYDNKYTPQNHIKWQPYGNFISENSLVWSSPIFE